MGVSAEEGISQEVLETIDGIAPGVEGSIDFGGMCGGPISTPSSSPLSPASSFSTLPSISSSALRSLCLFYSDLTTSLLRQPSPPRIRDLSLSLLDGSDFAAGVDIE